MNNVRKFVFGLGASALCMCVAVVGHNSAGSNTSDGLLAENIEALTLEEYDVETTWNCTGVPIISECRQKCGVCGSELNGKGSSTGSHKCSIKK